MKKKTLLKILLPVLIVIIIAAIFIIKKAGNKPSKQDLPQDLQITELPDTLKNADFSLRATEAIDFEAMAEYGIPLIVDYGADTCIPCKEMAPVLEKANKEFQGKAFIKFFNVWNYPEAANNVPVQVIPTQVLFNADGTPFVPSDELANQIQFDMYSLKETGEHAFTVHQGGLTDEQMWAILKEMGVE